MLLSVSHVAFPKAFTFVAMDGSPDAGLGNDASAAAWPLLHDNVLTHAKENRIKHCLQVALAAIATLTASCGDSPHVQGHVDGYASMHSKVVECDTSGLSDFICAMRSCGSKEQGDASPIDAELIMAWYHAQGDNADSIVHYATRALALIVRDVPRAETHPVFAPAIADMEFLLGVGHNMAGRFDSARIHFNKSYALSRALTYRHRRVQVCLARARMYSMTGDYQNCLTNIRDVEMVVDAAPAGTMRPSCRMVALSEGASIALDLCDLNTSERLLSKSSLVYDEASDRGKLLYLRQLMRLRALYRQYAQASAVLERIESLVSKGGLDEFRADGLACMGLVYVRQRDLPKAQEYRNQVDVNGLTPDGKAVLTLLDGEIALLQNDYDKAHALIFDSVAVPPLPYHRAFVSESRRIYWTTIGDYRKVCELFESDRSMTTDLRNSVIGPAERSHEEAMMKAAEQSLKLEEGAAKKDSALMVVLFVVILVGLLLVVVVYFAIVMRAKSKMVMAESLHEALQSELNRKTKEIESQTKAIADTNNRIAQSIAYAEHIQHSMLPCPDSLSEYPISGSFVFLCPLDVVSGDFFWFTKCGNSLVLVCADCTGHGVPGAFMSMIATTILNDVCKRIYENDVDPSVILERLDSSLIENLSHNHSADGNVKDGLDASVAVLDLETSKLKVASARRPVVVFQGDEMSVIKGTKRSIGEVDPVIRERAFQATEIQLAKHDKFYMYTDGYTDQFGGRDGDKMKGSKVERFLQSIYNDDMDEQFLTIQEFFIQWKGDYPQTDDITFVGIEV